MCVDKNNMETTRIESYQEIDLYLTKLKYALDIVTLILCRLFFLMKNRRRQLRER